MARTRKSIQPLNLYKYDVLIEDKGTRSDYFKVSQFDGYFYGGRNAFLVAGTGVLKPNSKILVEILNKEGTTVYSAPVTSFIEGNSRLVQIEIYNDTPIGAGKLVLLGCANTYLDGTSVPIEWQDKYNVRWIVDIIISPLIENKTPIRFEKTPSLVVNEKFYYLPSASQFTEELRVPVDIELAPKYYNIFPNGYLAKIKGPTNTQYISDYVDGFITGTITLDSISIKDTASISIPINKIYNSLLAESDGTLIYTHNKELILGGLLSSSGIYTTTIQPLGLTTVSSSISIQYNRLRVENTGSAISFAKLRLVDLKTRSGEINKVRISYKPTTEPGEFVVLGNINTEVTELLTIDSGSKVVPIGQFTNLDVSQYWYSETMSLNKADTTATLPTYYISSSMSSSYLPIVQSSAILLNSVTATPQIVNNKYINNSVYFIGTKSTNVALLFPRTEYTLKFDAIVSRKSESISLIQSDYSIEVYLVKDPSSAGKLLDVNPCGQLLGTLTPNSTYQRQNFENTEFNFTPKIIQSGNFGLRFIVYGGYWQIANVSVKPAQEPFFSPDEVDILVPNVNYTDKILTFKAEYLDINNNSIGLSTLSLPTYFTGSSVTITSTGGSGSSSYALTSSFATTASYARNSDLLDGLNSTIFATTGSNSFIGNQSISGAVTASNARITTRLDVGTVGQSTTHRVWSAGDTDIVALNPVGSTFGSLLEGVENAHFTVGLRSNDLNDSFQVITKEAGNSTYTKKVFSVNSAGDAIVSNNLTVQGNVSASSFTGSLFGTSSRATTSSYVLPTGLPTGILSSSTQVVVQNTTGIGALATTGSNTFIGNQTITGSLFITQNLVVQGSSSINYVSQSTLNIGTNIITVNVQNPSVRFGGLAVIDSGSSPQRSGSLFFDSTNDQWIFIHQNTIGGITSSAVLMGPPTFNNVGNETSLTQDRLLKGGGFEHVVDSIITDTGTNVGIGTASPSTKLDVNGGISIGGGRVVSASGNYTLLYRRDDNIGIQLGGSDPSNYYDNTNHVFRSSGGATTYVRIINTGDVGVGTTSPGSKLHVQGNVSASSFTGSLLGNATTSTSSSYAATSSVASANTLTGTTLASNVVNSSLTSVGTLTGLTVSADATINSVTVGRGSGNSNLNTVVGNASLNVNTTGLYNTAIGFQTLQSNTVGSGNTALGYVTMNANLSGSFNTAIGRAALYVNTTGSNNTGIGHFALFNNTSGSNNIAIGNGAGQSLTTGNNNTIIGSINGTAGMADTVIIAAGSAERLRIDSSGNMGIGTTSPVTKLDVNGGIAIGGVNAISASANYTVLYRRDGNIGIYLGGAIPSNYYDNNGHVFRSANGATTYMGIISTGDVGVGTASPGAKLHVQGNVSASSFTGSFSGSILSAISASFATTSSFATSASYAPGGSATFPYVGDAVISGSLIITGSVGLSVTGPTTVLGAFQATTKSFKIDHQQQIGKSLVYGVLESHEHGVYTRGKLTNNNTITLPEEWSWLVDEDSITVQLTPIGNHQKLYVKEITDTHVIIGNNSMFSNINCFYIIHATRKDVAPLITVE